MNTFEMEAKRLKAFCDPNRLKILNLLRSGEKCACNLLETLSITQPTLSHHMKILLESEVVVGRRVGKWTHYSLSQEGLTRSMAVIEQISTPLPPVSDSCCTSFENKED